MYASHLLLQVGRHCALIIAQRFPLPDRQANALCTGLHLRSWEERESV